MRHRGLPVHGGGSTCGKGGASPSKIPRWPPMGGSFRVSFMGWAGKGLRMWTSRGGGGPDCVLWKLWDAEHGPSPSEPQCPVRGRSSGTVPPSQAAAEGWRCPGSLGAWSHVGSVPGQGSGGSALVYTAHRPGQAQTSPRQSRAPAATLGLHVLPSTFPMKVSLPPLPVAWFY